MTTKEIADKIQQKKAGMKLFLVAIDGHGGSGKTTLVNDLIKLLEPLSLLVQVVPMDAFIAVEPRSEWKTLKNYPKASTPYKIDTERLKREVLEPLKSGHVATYTFHKDWWNTLASEKMTIAPEGIVIIEGCYSLTRSLRDYYDYKIFVDCSLAICMDRVSRRDVSLGGNPVTAPLFWKEIYFPAETAYMENEEPKLVADIVLEGGNRI